MSEAQELDTSRVENEEEEEDSSSARPMSGAVDEENTKKSSNPEDPDSRKTECATFNATKNAEVEPRDEPNNTTSSRLGNEKKKDQDNADVLTPSPTSKTLERSKPGECNLLPVLVERLRSALEQSCSSQSTEEPNCTTEDSGVDSEEDLRAWASGLCSNVEQQRLDEAHSPRGLKLDLKFLEDLLLSDIQTALGRLQETLKRCDIGTLTRYSSTLDPTNKLNLLKLISSLLANLKIPEEAAKPEKSAKGQSTLARRRRADRHTIGVSTEELARARKWLEEKSLSPSVVEPSTEPPLTQIEVEGHERTQESSSSAILENSTSNNKDNPLERLEEKQYDKVREKYMKDAINQQQSLQSKSKDSLQRDSSAFYEPPAQKLMDTSYKDDNTIINEEYGISASSLYHQSNAQAKCNKFLAKKSKIKRANTIDIPNYLKLQAESLANSKGGCVSLRRPINIGDKYLNSVGNVIPSFEPKTENDRKFLALISKNNETAATAAPSASLPFKSFNYRQAMADKNWNSRFSNIKTTFDKPQDENTAPRSPNEARRKSQSGEQGLIVGSLRLPYNGNRQKPGFSHAPTSPFQKIEKLEREESTPGFLKSGYTPKSGSLLQAKVKMFDQESANPAAPTFPTRSKARQLDPRRGSNLFAASDEQTLDPNSRTTDNGHLNYHSFCKQFAPFASKNPTEHKANPWSSGNIVNNGNTAKTNAREKFQVREKMVPGFGEDNRSASKVPVAYQAGMRYDRTDKKEKPRHRKLYESYDGPGETNGVPAHREVVAYPFEINYQKRPSFGKKYRDNAAEKGDYEDPEVLRQPPSPPPNLSSLQYIKSILPSARNPSPPPRSVFSVQSVAVQTNQTEPPRPVYPKENSAFASRDDNHRRAAPPPPPKDPSLQGRLLPEQSRRGSRQYNADTLSDTYESSSTILPPQRDDPAAFVAANQSAGYPAQGRPQLPQSTGQDANYPTSGTQYCAATEAKQQYALNSFGKTAPQVPLRSNPPQKVGQTATKSSQEPGEHYERYEKRSYEDFEGPGRIRDYQEYPANFYHDSINQNPIYVPPRSADRDAFAENNDPLPIVVSQPASSYSSDICNTEEPKSYDDLESCDISEEHSFADDENIQNQDISSEGVVTRYACAIATVSSASESPAVSPLPAPLKEPEERRPSRIFESSQPSSQREIPAHRDDRPRESEDLSLEEIRRHNLLQQNLIRQLQGDQSVVAKTARRLSQETAYRDESSSLSPLNFQAKVPEDQNNEPVIESNNTQDKINIFEGRNNSMRKQQQQQQHFKPLSIVRTERETFVPPKINVVSPSKVFKPSFKADARGTKITPPKASQKSVSPVDSSDEYLMSCASKPSRSIVLSKSESWHQLAMSKSTLQVPQAQPSSLLKPPKPKSPSSLRLSKQYEASSSSDAIRKMEEKIQRYFQGPSATGTPDSPVAARRDTKTKRNFAARKSQGSLMRSHTMPHIYDETNDVEKAFDSLFKEATRADNRY